MHILVTGGAGFIGSHTVDRLVERGHDVRVLDNLDPQVHGPDAEPPASLARHVEAGRVEFLRGDVRDDALLPRALDGIDAIAHLAAAVGVGQSMYQPRYYTSVNVDGQGALQQAMAARGAGAFRRFVVASSMSIYGEGAYQCATHGRVAAAPRPEEALAAGDWEPRCPVGGEPLAPVPTPESKPLHSTSVYAVTKKTQEEMALCWGPAYEVPTLALRFFNVFGSRQALSNPYTGVAAIFMGRLKNGNPPLIFEDGRQTRDFIHVSDVAESVVTALEADPSIGGAYNVCTGRPVSILDVARALAERLGAGGEPRVVGRYRAGDIRHCVGDPTLTRDALGFEARTTFEAGLDELIAWSAEQEAEDRVEASLAELERQGLVR